MEQQERDELAQMIDKMVASDNFDEGKIEFLENIASAHYHAPAIYPTEKQGIWVRIYFDQHTRKEERQKKAYSFQPRPDAQRVAKEEWEKYELEKKVDGIVGKVSFRNDPDR